jgi:tryptophan synthase alpha chain
MKKRLLSIYYTAGYPALNSTIQIAETLQAAGVDFLEIGMPYSDPVADGPVIQNSSSTALQNGMTVSLLFEQLKDLKAKIQIPVYLMGYLNPVLQYGVDRFCKACQSVGIKGVIIPDLPVAVYEQQYKKVFEDHGIAFIFMITPHTSAERIRKIDALSNDFIYLLSSPSVTGQKLSISEDTINYFQRIQAMGLKAPLIVGFGIRDHETFYTATTYADGAIVGTTFVQLLEKENPLQETAGFIRAIRGEE